MPATLKTDHFHIILQIINKKKGACHKCRNTKECLWRILLVKGRVQVFVRRWVQAGDATSVTTSCLLNSAGNKSQQYIREGGCKRTSTLWDTDCHLKENTAIPPLISVTFGIKPWKHTAQVRRCDNISGSPWAEPAFKWTRQQFAVILV